MARNQKLIADGALVQPVVFLLDLLYNVHSQLTEIHIKHKPEAPIQIDKEGKTHAAITLRFVPFLAKIIGFTNRLFPDVGIYTLDRVFDMYPAYIIKLRIVSHTLAPLLGVIPIEGKFGANIAKRDAKLQYHTVLKLNISDIHISLRDDQEKTIRFCMGKVIVTFRFQKQKLSQL